MTATFELTEADFEESLRPPAPKQSKQVPAAAGRNLIITVVIVAVSVALYLVLNTARPRGPAPRTTKADTNWTIVKDDGDIVWAERLNVFDVQGQLAPVIIASLPGVAFVLAITVFDFQQRRRSETKGQPKASNLIAYLLAGVVVIGVIGGFWAVNSTPIRFAMDRQTSIILLLAVGGGVLILTLLGVRLAARGAAARVAASPLVQGTTIMQIEADRIHTAHRLYENTQSWECIFHAVETHNLFILHVVKGGGLHVVPKRGFADPVDVHRVRALLKAKLPDGNYLQPPSAFPIVGPTAAIDVPSETSSADERRAE